MDQLWVLDRGCTPHLPHSSAQCAISGCPADAWHVAIGLRGSLEMGVDQRCTKNHGQIGISWSDLIYFLMGFHGFHDGLLIYGALMWISRRLHLIVSQMPF